MFIKIIFNYIIGYIRISIEGYYIERFINNNMEFKKKQKCKIRIEYRNKRFKKGSQNSKTNKMQNKNNKEERVTFFI